MQLNPAEISDLIKAKIENLSGNTEVRTRGTVISVTDGIVRIHPTLRRRRSRAPSSSPNRKCYPGIRASHLALRLTSHEYEQYRLLQK